MNVQSSIQIINPDSTGIDIGASAHFVAVPAGGDKETKNKLYTLLKRFLTGFKRKR